MPRGSSSIIRNPSLSIRLLRDDDTDYRLLAKWLTDERVLEFYEGRDNPHDLDKVRERYGPQGRGEAIPCILEWQGRPIGYMQFYALIEEGKAEYAVESIEGVYGMDLFIGEPEHWDKGIGTQAVLLLVRYLFETLGARQMVIDPHVSNLRAIRSYEKAGFRKVKVLPKHEWHEGEYRDCWLMVRDPVR